MNTRIFLNPDFIAFEKIIIRNILDFDQKKEVLGNQNRNVIKIVDFNDHKYTIKSFKIPNIINQFVYRFFRKSKAQRSFEYANKLLKLKIGTPDPVGYQLNYTLFTFRKSYYISEFIDYDLTYRELTHDFDIPDYENILRAFTRFTFLLHQNGVNFLDHSPGNTLIKRREKGYDFFLVDLNRMKFEKMDFETRIKNFAKLTIHESMVKIMSNEYAKCSGEEETKIFNLMWKFTNEFQDRYYQKKRIKRKIFFWKKKYRQAG